MTFKQKLLAVFSVFLLCLTSCDLDVQEPEKNYTVSFYEFDNLVLSFKVKESCLVSSAEEYSQVKNYKSTNYSHLNFKNWFTKDGTKASDAVITADTNFYASFYVNVNFYSKNGITLYSIKSYDVGTTIPEKDFPKLPQVTEDSIKYSFLYWSENKNATQASRAVDEYKNTAISNQKGTINLYPIYVSGPTHVITFYTAPNGTPTTKVFAENATIGTYSLPYDDYSHFLYWSESRANKSQAELKKFSNSTPITKDLTLYGIYTPYRAYFDHVENGIIKIRISKSSSGTYRFADGSIPGLDILYKKSSAYNYEPLTITSSTFDNTSSTSDDYLTCTFNPLTDDSYDFKVTSYSASTYYATIKTPKPVTNVAATVDDSYAKITWTKVSGFSYYTVKALNGTTVEQTIDYCTTSAEFYGLKNNTLYTFVVQTGNTSKTATITATPKITLVTADWVIAMYMDGDNNLNDPIYFDMNEVEYGLYKNSTSSIKAVALWDGSSQTTGDDAPVLKHEGSCIYELGTDTAGFIDYDYVSGYYLTDKEVVLSSNTKNLSYTAVDWLSSTKPSSITSSFYGEVNMGDKKTLENFLNWVKARYKANKGFILQFSDHGGGPKSVRYVYTKDGRAIKVGDEGRRALCWDESSSNKFLSTKDVATALKNAGYGGTNKIDMILMDVCLGASVEDAYEFSPYAKYLAASPNTIPGTGMDYVKFIQSLTSSATLENIGKQLITDYRTQYHTTKKMENLFNTFYGPTYNYDSYTQAQINTACMFSDSGFTTLSFIDLTKISDLKDSINTLAGLLVNDSSHNIYYLENNNQKLLSLDTQDPNLISMPLKKWIGQNYMNYSDSFGIVESMYYKGSYSWLLDIGELCKCIMALTNDTINTGTSNVANPYAWSDVYNACEDVRSKCNDAILYSWRDYYKAGFSTFYSPNYYNRPTTDSDNAFTGYCNGLTICGANIATQGDSFVPGSYPDFYGNLNFGKENGVESNWYKLLKQMFGN